MRDATKIKKVVVKVGTKLLTSKKNGLDRSRMGSIVSQICSLQDDGIKVVLVSSGAIGAGMSILGLKRRPTSMPELQAAAAIGQSRLMQIYDSLFKRNNKIVAQVLLTQEDLNDRRRYLNAKNTINTLLDRGAIPIINENDTVSTEEIRFGDNDRLSSLVATLVEADRLIILTDVKGLYDSQHRLVTCVEKITKDIKSWAKGSICELGTGGMVTKIIAAQAVVASGIGCAIADGRKDNILLDIVYCRGKQDFTYFKPEIKKLKAKKSWIMFASKCVGKIIVDQGAEEALTQRDKSLLASGIIGVEGKFDAGCAVKIVDKNGEEFAKGLVNYSSIELDKIKGLRTDQIKKVLGQRYFDEAVHKDNLVIL